MEGFAGGARGDEWSENGVTERLRTADTFELRKTSTSHHILSTYYGEKGKERAREKHTVNGIDMSFRENFHEPSYDGAKGEEILRLFRFFSHVKLKLMK